MPRALLSVSDKTGLVDFARALQDAGWSLVSTGGTLAALTGAGLDATAVEEVTGFPELLDDRVKTLHPRVHAGVLARDTDGHRAELEEHGHEAFDQDVAHLYPLRETAGRADAGTEEIIENIDNSGPALVRAAAETHERGRVDAD